MNGLQKLFATNDSITSTIVRLTLGAVMLPHGLQKTLGWLGGYGFSGTMGFFTNTLGLPWIVAFMVIVTESFGAISLLLGFATRVWAAALIAVMLGAISMAHFENGFFMNWYGTQKGEGFEYHLLVIGMALALVISGAGKLSVDRVVTAE